MSSFCIGLAATIYNSQIVSGCIAIIQSEPRFFIKAGGVLGILFLKIRLNLVINTSFLKGKIIDSKVDAFFLQSSIARSSIYQRNTIVYTHIQPIAHLPN